MNAKRSNYSQEIRKSHRQYQMLQIRNDQKQLESIQKYLQQLEFCLLCQGIDKFSFNINKIIIENPQLKQSLHLWLCGYVVQLQQLMIMQVQNQGLTKFDNYLQMIQMILLNDQLNDRTKQKFIHKYLLQYMCDIIIESFKNDYKSQLKNILSVFELSLRYANKQQACKLQLTNQMLLQIFNISKNDNNAIEFISTLLYILPIQLEDQPYQDKLYQILSSMVMQYQQLSHGINQKNDKITWHLINVARHFHFKHCDLSMLSFILLHSNAQSSLQLISHIVYKQSWIQYEHLQQWIHYIRLEISLQNYSLMNILLRILYNLIINSNINRCVILNVIELLGIDQLYLFVRQKLLQQFIHLFTLLLNCLYLNKNQFLKISKLILNISHNRINFQEKKKLILILLLNNQIDQEECQTWIPIEEIKLIIQQIDMDLL